MRVNMITMLVLAMGLNAGAQSYQPLDAKSSVKFTIKNFGVNTGGTFKGVQGAITWEGTAPQKGGFDISVDATTVDTDNESRDNHLRKEEYFNVEQYPKIGFKSDRVTVSGKSFTVYGKLTIKNTTKDISIPFTATAKDGGYLFEGSFELNRKDYKVGGNSMVLGDNVTLTLSIFAQQK